MVKLRALALLAVLLPTAAFGQAQIGAGHFWANDTAAQRAPRDASITAIFDQALANTRGSFPTRGASGWTVKVPGTSGKPYVSNGAGADPDYQTLGIVGGGTNCAAASGTCLDNITGFSSTGYLKRTGPGAYSFVAVTAGIETFLVTNSCANLRSAVTGVTGTCGNLVFSQGPTVDSLVVTTAFTATGLVGYAALQTAALAVASDYFAGTASKLVNTGIIYQGETTTTFGSTTTFDFSTFINTRVTLTANITTMNVSNVTPGKAGHIVFKQSGAGSFTTVFNSIFKFAGGTVPSLTTGSTTAEDVLFYDCTSATVCYASLNKDMK